MGGYVRIEYRRRQGTGRRDTVRGDGRVGRRTGRLEFYDGGPGRAMGDRNWYVWEWIDSQIRFGDGGSQGALVRVHVIWGAHDGYIWGPRESHLFIIVLYLRPKHPIITCTLTQPLSALPQPLSARAFANHSKHTNSGRLEALPGPHGICIMEF